MTKETIVNVDFAEVEARVCARVGAPIYPLSDQALREAGPPLTLDNSMRQTFLECPLKFYFSQRGYDYARTPSYFAFGRIWHDLLRIWYTLPPEFGPEARAEDPSVLEAVKAIIIEKSRKLWAAEGIPDGTLEKASLLEEMFLDYVEHYPSESWYVLKGGDEAGWEYPFATVGGLTFSLGGAIDSFIRWEPYGVLPLEHKTSGSWLSDAYIGQWKFSPQITQYIWYATRVAGKECYGCLVNMATKRRSKAGKTPPFARSLETRSAAELELFEESWTYDLRRLLQCWEEWKWPRTGNPINCVGGVGKSACLYRPICLAGRRPEEIDPLSFPGIGVRDKPWAPWKREGDVNG